MAQNAEESEQKTRKFQKAHQYAKVFLWLTVPSICLLGLSLLIPATFTMLGFEQLASSIQSTTDGLLIVAIILILTGLAGLTFISLWMTRLR